MKKKGVFHGRKVFLITDDPALLATIQEHIGNHGAILFSCDDPNKVIGQVMVKNPELIIYDDRFPDLNGTKVLSLIKRLRPHSKVLLLSKVGVPLRAIDVTAQGVAHSVALDSNPKHIYNTVKHCLSIASVPRVEEAI